MIHYHGTPIGGSNQDAAKFLMSRHALVSYVYQQQMSVVADVCSSFILDNGAFTMWKRGAKLDYEGYLNFVFEWYKHPGFDWAIIPDVIDGTEEENDDYITRWPKNLRGAPVYHIHEPVSRLKQLCNDFQTVCLGSSGKYHNPGSKKWWKRISFIMEQITDENGRPPSRLHGLRMLNPSIFTLLPLTSADSTNVGANVTNILRFGVYKSPSASIRAEAIASRIEIHNSCPTWCKKNQLEIFNKLYL